MYFQVFISNQATLPKQSQFSCDNWNEVQELLEVKKPDFVRVDYHNSFGLIGKAWKAWNSNLDKYTLVRKESYQKGVVIDGVKRYFPADVLEKLQAKGQV